MEMKSGTIESFDEGTQSGVLRLDEDRGGIAVRFSADACRGVFPTPGVRVLAGQIDAEPGAGGPLSDSFAMRAGVLEVDRGVGNVAVAPTIGLREPVSGTTFTGKPLLRIP